MGREAASDTENGQPPLDSTAVGAQLFTETWETYVAPELARRSEAGEWPEGEPLYRWQVLLRDEAVEVRLNREVGGSALAALPRGSVAVGAEVRVDDVTGIAEYRALPEDADVPHVTAFRHAGGWSVAFSFNRPHPARHEHLGAAQEFVDAAQAAFERGHTRAFLDNAYSATELLAKSELLSSALTVELALSTRGHGGVAAAYNVWARLGNTDAPFARLLNKLGELRRAARYLHGDLRVTAEESEGLRRELEAMHEHVRSVVSGQTDRQGYNVIATRPLAAGSIVSTDDYTLWPPRSGGEAATQARKG